MDLKTYNEGQYQSSFYCPTGETVDEKSCELLGFKNGIPVLRNGKDTSDKISSINLSSKHTFRFEINPETGEKFVNYNGKKLRMLTGFELPSHLKQKAQVIKATSLNYIDPKPVQIKIIGSAPIQGSKKFVKLNMSRVTSNSLKYNVNKTDNGNILLSNKTVVIMDHNTKLVKIPSVTKVITENSIATTSSNTVNSVVNSVLPQLPIDHEIINKTLHIGNGVVKVSGDLLKMNPLDLSKVNKVDLSSVEVKKIDKCVQTLKENTSKDEAVQTDIEEKFDPVLDILNMPFIDYLNSDELMWAPSSKITSFKRSETTSKPNSTVTRYNEKHIMFFNDIKNALVPDADGNMPIHDGVLKNNIDLVKKSCYILKVLQQPVDVLNHGDLTALQLAIVNNSSPQIVRILLSYNASLYVVDSEGNNIIHLAIEYKRTELLDTLLRFADEHQLNLNLNEFNGEGLTALMMCCCNNLYECADLLIKYHADVNIKDRKSGRTALFHAAESHNLSMVQLLLNNSADTKIKNFFGTSPHDAMYEVEEIPEKIRSTILGKVMKRKIVEEPRVVKVKVEENMVKLKTYARFKKVNAIPGGYTIETMAK